MASTQPESLAPKPEKDLDAERLEELRSILLRKDEQFLREAVQSVIDTAMAHKIEESKDEMAAILAPIMGQAIRRQVQEAQDDIIDALYPVIGKTIQRSVAEAMRALARRVDTALRDTLNLRGMLRRLRARLRGIPESDLLLREALHFQIQEMFLIHRDSGLLLEHLSADPARDADRDLVSGMLTAIRDFARDTFGTGREGELEEIQYGSLSILVEPGPWAYLAVVTEGFAPAGFRHEMRTVLSAINRTYVPALRDYDGDAARIAGVEDLLHPLMQLSPQEYRGQGAAHPRRLASSP